MNMPTLTPAVFLGLDSGHSLLFAGAECTIVARALRPVVPTTIHLARDIVDAFEIHEIRVGIYAVEFTPPMRSIDRLTEADRAEYLRSGARDEAEQYWEIDLGTCAAVEGERLLTVRITNLDNCRRRFIGTVRGHVPR